MSIRRVVSILIALSIFSSCLNKSRVTECVNPVIFSDVPDAQIVHVDSMFYLFSSSDYTSRGIHFISSNDLVHWKPSGRIYEPDYASTPMKCVSVIERDGVIYVMYYSLDAGRNVLYSTDSISDGEWDVSMLESSYQCGSLFFESGRLYFVYAEEGHILLKELETDFNPSEGQPSEVITSYVSDKEISHPSIHHIGEWYYLLLTEQDDKHYSRQLCGRSKELSGEYQFNVVLDGVYEYIEQGQAMSSLFETYKGNWYAMCGIKLGAYGYGVALQPVTWKDGWPIMGEKTSPVKSFKVRLGSHPEEDRLFEDEDFSDATLSEAWQILERSDSARWSLTEKPGWLRMYSDRRSNELNDSELLLFHRVNGELVIASTTMYIGNMKPGQYCGIASYQGDIYAMVGVHMNRLGRKHMVWQEHVDGKLNLIYENKQLVKSDFVPLSLGFYPKYRIVDGRYKEHTYSEWNIFYPPHDLNTKNYDDLFGMRLALFNYTTGETGGSADFDGVQFQHVNEIDR